MKVQISLHLEDIYVFVGLEVTIGCGLQSKRYWLAGMAVGKLGRACT
jgi:hypothetical protein